MLANLSTRAIKNKICCQNLNNKKSALAKEKKQFKSYNENIISIKIAKKCQFLYTIIKLLWERGCLV